MATAMTIADRLRALFDHLGIGTAHIAGGGMGVPEFCLAAGSMAASTTVVNPITLTRAQADAFTCPLALISADCGPFAEHGLPALAGASIEHHTVLEDCEGMVWSDVVQDRATEVGDVMEGFLGRIQERLGPPRQDEDHV